jgi:glycyl-tRNA synthetase
VYPSAEIYGGFRSSYDYGPLGSLMLRNVRESWIRTMVQKRDDVVLIDAAILGPPQVFEASGHLANFSDPLVDCKTCKQRFREDHLEDKAVCPNCGAKDTLTEARAFNLMFKTFAGPVEGSGAEVYLRPETAQGMFVNFANVLQTSRKKPPFGIAQVGKSFRNEITPGNFIFRTREFEQMELEFFVPPAEGPKWYEYWMNSATTQQEQPTSNLPIHGVGENLKELLNAPTLTSISMRRIQAKSLISSISQQTNVMYRS